MVLLVEMQAEQKGFYQFKYFIDYTFFYQNSGFLNNSNVEKSANEDFVNPVFVENRPICHGKSKSNKMPSKIIAFTIKAWFRTFHM